MMQEFEGRTAVITSAASGRGLAMAECFARDGMNVVLADVEAAALQEEVRSQSIHRGGVSHHIDPLVGTFRYRT